ncbi:hypothetical protein BC939DRAFT_479743 [Gamsiella multidivaricata]|uniref:uncharacterized protein n=1 Tax=Gamsiella multidivaricata TaxID=101098 RepID=UPI002220E788|nr:uncharacterized protein BC939DRAFT_479743 [Gamsiella multidivaricata]KAI7819228.1 hypothetical protein BC939DRAFT_479743 [Gamsiella multidivaricata]
MSSRLKVRSQARAIPLVTVSLANGHPRQTSTTSNTDHPSSFSFNTDSTAEEDLPPPYDHASHSTTSNRNDNDNDTENDNQLTAATPRNEDLTEAVLHLSRTLVSTSKAIPRPKSSWLFMMIYNWTHIQRPSSRLYHILTRPVAFLKGIREPNDQALVHQPKRSHKSMQQLTEEQDRLEDDPDMLNGATEMVPVTMLNIRSAASMEESRPEDPDAHKESSDDELNTPRKPRRQIDQYPNPFGPGVSSDDELEDDEGWLGRGEDRSEEGHTKSNSVRLTTPTISHKFSRQMPDFPTPSLGPAMDPRQFESGEDARAGSSRSSVYAASLFNKPTGATFDRLLSTFPRSDRSMPRLQSTQ